MGKEKSEAKLSFQKAMEDLGWTYCPESDLRSQWRKSNGRRNGVIGQDSEQWRNDVMIAQTAVAMKNDLD